MGTMVTVHASPIVLVACADAETSESLTAILESWHYAVEVAANGTEALVRLTTATAPAMALLDMDLPVVSGAAIAAELRRRAELRPGWVMLLSRHTNPERVRQALESGCDDFLRIPVDAADLRVRVRVAERVMALTTQVQKQSAELRYHATHDGLTGLWNRESLLSLIFQETDRVQRMRTPLSLMLLDLDDFSRVNHDYGYEAGDRVLVELASRFRRQLRSYDLIGRCGEDEFLLALPGCTLESARELAGRIREGILSRPFAAGHEATTLTASIGVAVSHGRSPLIVLREAERGLAEAKLGGKNRVCGDGPEIYMEEASLMHAAREAV
ncbi:MAG TPA: diguanylate cyclase [Acidobacteriaceae bacterium]|jgi:diguanylate cyclase (GGDEF)-like protein|nr:diguanylate cyclase [Acidobacteriaceae bacterium]